MYSNGSNSTSKTPPPKLSATFFPGDQDNYHMPVISPIPQRSMPEVPDQIQQNLAKLELDSRPISPGFAPTENNNSQGVQSYGQQSLGASPANPGLGLGLAGIQNSRNSPRLSPRVSPRASPRVSPIASSQTAPSIPSQSLLSSEPFFPHIKNPPPNIPARADETENLLESARLAVLNSNDAESQIIWAQDALAYVYIATENNARLAEAGMGRSKTPPIEHQLRVDAMGIINFLANQHHPKAEFLKGMWLEFGRFGHQIDKPQAYRCFATAARNGFARAEYRIGMQFEETGELDKALRHYNLGVQASDPASYYRMGMMYILGQKGQRQDIQRGLDYIKYSADNADDNAPQGSYVYGMLLAKELPQITIPEQMLPRDILQAKYYLEKAAYLGFSHAQTRLGSAYELQQLGCDFDPVYSLHYNRLAARQGEPEAEMAISKWFLSGYEGVFPKNEAVAYEYALRAAKSGYPTAEFAMGYFNEVGIHVPSNITEAKVWYGKAAEHGSEDAKGRITGISRSKTLSRKDHDNMALAKIKSVRGRPKTQQQNLQMPQIDSYRHPSPVGNSIPSTTPVSQPYNRDQYYGPSQDPHSDPRMASQDGIPNMGVYNSSPSNNRLQTHSVPPPMTNQYNQPPSGSLQPAAPYSNRQSSLPQGYRMSSQGLPTGPPTNPGRPISNVNRIVASPPMGSGHPSPATSSYAADIGYSAPADFGGADRRRIASGPAQVSGPGIYNKTGGGGGLSNCKPMPSNQPISSAQRPPRTDALQSKPGPMSQSTSAGALAAATAAAATPPPKATVPPTQGKKPGKGPSTFAEMGIPQAKTESDCVLM